jgi:acyl-CoA synthetase (AMP-forming)/AMP-acid ligase II
VRTGDAGFVADGELYVLGRLGDSLKVRGRSVFAEGVEEAVAAEVGVSLGGLGVVLGVLGGLETVALVMERDPGDGLQPAVDTVARLAPGARALVLTGNRGSIPRTTSGKPRRKVLWAQLAAPDHAFTVLYDSEAR